MGTKRRATSTDLVKAGASMLTAEQFRRLSKVPTAIEWLANITNTRTRRVYESHASEFARFVGLTDMTTFGPAQIITVMSLKQRRRSQVTSAFVPGFIG